MKEPVIPTVSDFNSSNSFPDCGSMALGLYPIVDRSEWLELLLPCGITTIQLRIKDKTGPALENEIKESVNIAKHYGARLFINDYWELAIQYAAYGVHLGQEDLNTANIKDIYQAGLRLGISTHCYDEIMRAYQYKPSYLAYGPIFETNSKVMNFAPQGIANLKHWKQNLKNYPLVAIGGINIHNISSVLETDVNGIAMISAITKANDPIQMTKTLLQKMELFICQRNS